MESKRMIYNDHASDHTYGLVREEYHLGGDCRVAYGIAAFAHPDETGSASIIASARDLSADRASVEALVRQCNERGLSPVHLCDVADDCFGT